MSIDIGKIIQVYEGCLTLLKAKQNLNVNSDQLNALFQKYKINRAQNQNLCVQFIQDGIFRILITWKKKFGLYDSFKDQHQFCYSQLYHNAESLKNNSQLVTRQDQLIAQIQKMMAQWRQNMDPTQYYNTKYRRMFKQQMQQKLQDLKHCMNKNFNVTAPHYTRKVQSEFKDNVFAAYYQETKIDRKLVEATIFVHDEIAQVLGQLDDLIIQSYSDKEIQTQSSYFLRDILQILHRTSRPSDRRLRVYAQSLSNTVKKCYEHWCSLRKSLDHLLLLINQIIKAFTKIKSNLEQKQEIIAKLLQQVPYQIGNLFRTSTIHNIINSFNSLSESSKILNEFKNKIIKRRQLVVKNQNECINYSNQIVEQANLRYENFHHFAITDKRFFDEQSKSEKTMAKMIIQNFKQFLQQCYNLTKATRKIFLQKCKIQELNQKKLDEYLSLLIINDIDDITSKQQSMTMVSQNASYALLQTSKRNQNSRKAQNLIKIAKIDKFINDIQLFESGTVSQNEKNYSCALGPKILLHGKLFLLPEGIFFESQFNKKNLLFGKTKMYIPKSEILQIDMKNTLVVFPDAVIVKTQHGLVSFHALGYRKEISDAIKQTYLGEISQEGSGQVGGQVINFKPFDQGKKSSEEVIKNKSSNLQTIFSEITLKGSNLKNVFKRYFSDQKFTHNSKEYQSFKGYALTLIDAKNPKSTTLTPPPPIYFTLKSQKDPQIPYPTISIRQHIYGKDLPKIPFLSKGGEGQCSQKQTYTWMGPETLCVDVVSTVKGFSLTQNMEVFLKYVIKQLQEGVKITVSAQVKFSKESSSNGLVKGPTLSNMKQSITKILQTIQKCEKSFNVTMKSSKKQQKVESAEVEENQPLKSSNEQINFSKQQLLYAGIGLIIFYILTIVVVKLF